MFSPFITIFTKCLLVLLRKAHGAHVVSRPGIGSIREYHYLSIDPLSATRRPCQGETVRWTAARAHQKASFPQQCSWYGLSVPSGTTRGWRLDGVGGKRGVKKGCEMEREAGDSDSSLSPHIIPLAPQAPSTVHTT